MPNTLSPETAIEVATARADAWKGIATDLCEILQGVVVALEPKVPELAQAISQDAIGPISKGFMMIASEVQEENDAEIGDDPSNQEYYGRLGSEEVAEALALETDVLDRADLSPSMSMRLR